MDIGSLRALGPLHDFKLDRLSFLQGSVTVTDDSGIMDENIGAIVAPDESVSFRIVEPFYRTTQSAALPRRNCSFPFFRVLAEKLPQATGT